MNRVTESELQSIVDRINRICGTPDKPYVNGNSQVGNYHLGFAYGGVELQQMENESGGVRTPLGCGHVTKRELRDRMHAFISGLYEKQEAKAS